MKIESPEGVPKEYREWKAPEAPEAKEAQKKFTEITEIKLGEEGKQMRIVLDYPEKGKPIDIYLSKKHLQIVNVEEDPFWKVKNIIVDPEVFPKGPGGFKGLHENEPLILGREETYGRFEFPNDVSRKHIRIIDRNGKIEIEDLNSKNGTRVKYEKEIPREKVEKAMEKVKEADQIIREKLKEDIRDLERIEGIEEISTGNKNYILDLSKERLSLTEKPEFSEAYKQIIIDSKGMKILMFGGGLKVEKISSIKKDKLHNPEDGLEEIEKIKKALQEGEYKLKVLVKSKK